MIRRTEAPHRATPGTVIKLELLLGSVSFASWVFCLVDVIGNPSASVRNLPKVA